MRTSAHRLYLFRGRFSRSVGGVDGDVARGGKDDEQGREAHKLFRVPDNECKLRVNLGNVPPFSFEQAELFVYV